MAPRSKAVFQGIKDYPKALLKQPSLGAPKVPLPRITLQDYTAGSPLKLTGSEGPLSLTPPKLKKPKLPK